MDKKEIKTIPNDDFFASVKEILAEGESVRLIVTGRSMDPTFKDRKDQIVISPFDPAKLRVGDVVLFDRGDTICVHRIILRVKDRLIIRGDGNMSKSLEPANVSDVIGLVTGGTMRGKEFKITDNAWKRNTRLVMKFFPLIEKWHHLKRIVTCYPFSLIAVIVLLLLSFLKVGEPIIVNCPGADKWVHALMYFTLSMVFWFEWLRVHRVATGTLKRGFLFCVIVPIFMGGAIELGQEYLTLYRSGEWLDFAADAAGTLIAAVFALSVLVPVVKRFKKRLI